MHLLGGLGRCYFYRPMEYKHDEAVWYAHKVVCAYYDAGVKPTVANLRENWRANYYANKSDEWLNDLIEQIGRFYN